MFDTDILSGSYCSESCRPSRLSYIYPLDLAHRDDHGCLRGTHKAKESILEPHNAHMVAGKIRHDLS